ncbi:MAG: c-type cytochrome [Solirubrobacterales bacterium]|nr:c-type cytochrome [Solirubrobacterales bacterium]
MTFAARLPLLALGAAAVAALAGCSANSSTGDADLVAGKQLFVKNCGSCHVLNRAGTKGNVGPNLDNAFTNPVSEGFGETAIRGMVHQMIDIGSALRENGRQVMQPDLVTGDDARDVAAYVAQSVAKPGKDTGLLASAVKPAGSGKPAVAANGVLTIPADPNGQLAFVNATATAPAGQVKLVMPNESGVQHNIAIQGKGQGPIVDKGESSFSATFAPGKYTYFCQVAGHEAAGMKGTLTVK